MAEEISIVMRKKEAEELSLSISDVLCWIQGFNAGRAGSNYEGDGPYGVNELRAFNLKLKKVAF